jgi:predicted metalloprotease
MLLAIKSIVSWNFHRSRQKRFAQVNSCIQTLKQSQRMKYHMKKVLLQLNVRAWNPEGDSAELN